MNTVTMTISELRALMVDAGTVAAKKALTDAGLVKATMSKRAAYKKYGQPTVDRWLKNGLIQPNRDNYGKFSFRLDANELEALSKADNRHRFIYSND